MESIKKHEKAVWRIYLIVIALVPVSLCFNQNIWLDEAYSLRWSMLPFGQMMNKLIHDVHPPLYYLLLRVVLTLFGNHIIIAKLFSVLAFIFILVTGIRFVKKQFGRKAYLMYSLLLLCVPMMLKKTIEIRMYTWTYLFIILAGVELFYLLQKPDKKNWVLFTVCSAVAAYLHYFAVLTLVFVYPMIFVFFLINRNRLQIKNWVLCCVTTVLLYLPWLPITLNQLKGDAADWIEPSTSRLGPIRELFESDIPWTQNLLMMLVILSFVIAFVFCLVRRDAIAYWQFICMIPLWGVLTFGQLYGSMYKPILISRYLMIPLCLTILGISSLIKYLPRMIVFLIAGFIIIIGAATYKRVFIEEYVTKTDITVEFMKENFEENETILTDGGGIGTVILHYFPLAIIEHTDRSDYDEMPDVFWYFDCYSSIDMTYWEEEGFECVTQGQYGLDNVYFTIYRLKKN